MRRFIVGFVVSFASLEACGRSPQSTPPTSASSTPITATTPELPPTEPAPPTVTEDAATAELEPLERVACDRKGVLIVPPTLKAELDCYPDCPADGKALAFRIINCTDRKLKLDSIGRATEGYVTAEVKGDWARVLDPGTRSPELRVSARGPDSGKLTLELVNPDAPDDKRERVELPLAVSDKKLDQAKLECKKRGDFWGAQGLAGWESCWKVMRDAGKTCHDKRDCGGECIFVSQKDVSATEKLVTGNCSKFETQFGCAMRIGHTKKGRMPISENIPSMCAD